jgi:hypothetical protein
MADEGRSHAALLASAVAIPGFRRWGNVFPDLERGDCFVARSAPRNDGVVRLQFNGSCKVDDMYGILEIEVAVSL